MGTRRGHLTALGPRDAHDGRFGSWSAHLTNDQPYLGCEDSTVPAIRHKYLCNRQQAVSRDDGWTG